MTVYVDDGKYRYGRMIMSHMIADTTEELLHMASEIGVNAKWLQSKGTWKEHFDVCQVKRMQAIAMGAVPISKRDLAQLLKARRIHGCKE